MKRTGQNKIAVVGWGRGMGHTGHMYLADAVIQQAKDMKADPYFFVSKTVGKDDPLLPEEKLKIYQTVFPQQKNIFTPQGNLNQALQELAALGYEGVVLVVGADQKESFKYLEKPNKEGVPVYQTFGFKKLRVISRQETRSQYRGEAGPRATPMREILLNPEASDEQKYEVWRRDMPSALSDEQVMSLMTTAAGRLMATNKPKKLKENRIIDPKALINAFYVSPQGNRHRVAEKIPYYLLDKLVPLLTKKYAITMNDIEVRPADVNQYRRTSQPDLAEEQLDEFAPNDNGGRPKFIPWNDFIAGVKGIVGNDFAVTEKVIKSTIQDRFVPHDPMEFGPTMLYSYYEARAGRGKGAVSTRGSIQVGKYYPNNTALGKQNFITQFSLLKGHPFERHFDLTPENISKVASIILGNTEGAYQMQQGVAEGSEEALAYATQAHAGQTRSGGDPYITHPMRVADHIRKYKQSHNLDALISAAYLHDTIEDTSTTQEALHDLFGGLVASLVQELTSDPEEIKRVGKKQYLAHKMAAMSSYALVIKLADRLDNVKDITTAKTPEWRHKYATETNHILDYIEKTRALSSTHRKLIELIRAKLAEVDNPQQGVDEGIFDRFKKKPAAPEVADPGNYPRIGGDIAQWMADTVEYHKAKFPDSVWKLFCPTYPDYLPVRVRVGTSEKIMHQHLEDYINLRNQNPEAVRIARQKFDKNNTYPSGPRDDYTTKVSEQGVAEEAPGMKDGRPYSDPLRRHPGNESYMTPEYLIQKYKERLAQIASGPYKRPKEVAQLQSRIAKLEKQGLEEAGFDKEEFRRHMEQLRAREEMRKTDPVSAKALDLRDALPQATKKKPEDDSIGINDPRHPGYAYTQAGQHTVDEAGITRRGILKGIGAAGLAGAADKASAIAGALPTPSHRAAMYKAAADSNRAEAKRQAELKAKDDSERLEKNTQEVDREQRINHHKLDEFAPGNGDDDKPTAEYEVYQCSLDDQFDWIGGPLMQTDDMGKAHGFAYFLWKKHPDKCFMIWQERSQGSRGGYGPEGSVLAPSKEELDEVSDKTLVSYLTKVDSDSRKHKMDPTKRSDKKASKSVSGFSKAFNKLDSRKPDGTIQEDYLDE